MNYVTLTPSYTKSKVQAIVKNHNKVSLRDNKVTECLLYVSNIVLNKYK